MKSDFYKELQTFPSLMVDVSFQSVSRLLKTSNNAYEIHNVAQETLIQMKDKWKPSALIQWFDFALDRKTCVGKIKQNSSETVSFSLGHSGIFLEKATHVMVSVHSIGAELDLESANASTRGDFLKAYVIDLIGLVALEKTSNIIKSMAEDQARKKGWGVGPFLSPGSVHGWDLIEQSKLCALLPIDKINVTMKNSSVLSPIKTVAGLIGIGPAYEGDKVGSTCDVCSKKDKCQMSQVI